MAQILSDKPVLNAWTYNLMVRVEYDPLNREKYQAFQIIGIESRDYGFVVEGHGHGKYPWYAERPMFDTEEEVDGWMRQVNYDRVVQSATRLLDVNRKLRTTARVNLMAFEERIDRLRIELKSDFKKGSDYLPRGRIRTR